MKVLYIISTYSLYGGTPKKTLDLMNYFGAQSVLYVYNDSFKEFKKQFEASGGKVYEGFYNRNILKHLRALRQIIDLEGIEVVQTQFSMGEILGFLIKLFRPKVKLIVAFVGSSSPSKIKSIVVNQIYKSVDFFVFISKFVKKEKVIQFPILKIKPNKIIYNGTNPREVNNTEAIVMQHHSIFDIAGLIHLKNIQVLIAAFNILLNEKKRNDVFLYIAGDGPMRSELEVLIEQYKLDKHVFLLGYQENVGKFLNSCDLFVHPAYAEGFGIVVAEAMLSEKPIIVSNAGALPEIIEHNRSGLIVDPYNPEEWAEAINRLLENPDFSKQLARTAYKRANELFSHEVFCKEYEKLYQYLLK